MIPFDPPYHIFNSAHSRVLKMKSTHDMWFHNETAPLHLLAIAQLVRMCACLQHMAMQACLHGIYMSTVILQFESPESTSSWPLFNRQCTAVTSPANAAFLSLACMEPHPDIPTTRTILKVQRHDTSFAFVAYYMDKVSDRDDLHPFRFLIAM